MAVIEISDQQAASLAKKAAERGLTLEAWLKQLADQSSAASRTPREAADRILALQKRVKPDPDGWTVSDYINRDRP